MAWHQHHTAQNFHSAVGHATRAGHIENQPYHYDFAAGGYGFPRPPTFENKLEEREYLKGRLAAAFRIFGKNGFDEGVAGHITIRVSASSNSLPPCGHKEMLTDIRTLSSLTPCGSIHLASPST